MSGLARLPLFLLALALVVASPRPSPAQWVSQDREDDPLEQKELAQAKFEASRRAIPQLARERVDAARVELRERAEEVRIGKRTVDILLDVVRRLAQSEMAVAGDEAARIAALERQWEIAYWIEQALGRKYREARASVADYMQTRYARLSVQVRLIKAREGKRGREVEAASLIPLPRRDESSGTAEIPRAKYELTRTPLRRQLRQRLDAVRTEYVARAEEVRIGKRSIDFLMDAASGVLDAEQGLAAGPAEEIDALERYWRFLWVAESVLKAKYETGSASIADYLQTRAEYLAALIRLRQTRERHKKGPGLSSESARSLLLYNPFEPEDPAFAVLAGGLESPLDTQSLARDEFEAAQASPKELRHERLEAARICLRARKDEVQIGKRTVDLLLDAASQVLHAELAVAENRAARLAARERYWWTCLRTERLVEAKYAAKSASLADTMQTRYARLDAEIRLLRARQQGAK